MNNYPPGAANDPDAPYNQPLPDTRRVLVSMCISKEFDVDVFNNNGREVNEGDVRLVHFLPDDILNQVAKPNSEFRKLVLDQMKRDAADWTVDNITVIES